MKLRELAERIGCAWRGDGEVEITGVSGMEHATPTQITFLANPKYAHKVKSTKAGAIIIQESAGDVGLPSLLSENPYLDFARALEQFYRPPRPEPGIDPTAVVHPTATVGPDASIGAYCVIGAGVRIGRGAVMYPHVVIYDGCQIGDHFTAHSGVCVREATRIGNRVILQNNVVVGADGYGFAKLADGSHYKIVQSGPVVLEDDVEIQSMSNVDRATVGETRIREGAKIDSMVQIGHACDVGEKSIICSQTGLAGSTVLKKNVLLAGQVGVSGHLTINDNAVVYAQSGIGGDIEAGAVMSGSPAFDAATWRRAVAAFPRLPEMVKAMRQLEKRLAALENQRIKEVE
jgi:UDP-3-O-[3-hydroxymyristoyl] glucosamine N-acyltransferase